MGLPGAHALVIGIARYQRARALRATDDARDVAAALVDPAGAGYPPGQVHVLLEDAATRAAILAALDDLARAVGPGSTVLVYYSGHGAYASRDGGAYYTLPVDGDDSSRDALERTAISSATLSARLAAIGAARLTVILDCCRAGALAALPMSDAIAPLAAGRGRAVIAASRATGLSYALPGARDSALTTYLVEGLRGGAAGVGGVIRVCDLFHYVQQRVAALPIDQHPVFRAELEENYPIAAAGGGASSPLALPPAPDAVGYDAYVSYCEADDDDRAWATGTLIPFLEAAGLRLCLEDRDFALGANRVGEIDRAVTASRYTVAVLSPAYFAHDTEAYEALIAAQVGSELGAPRLIPLIRRRCALALHARMTAALDASVEDEVPAALARLAVALRQPPRARLGGVAES